MKRKLLILVILLVLVFSTASAASAKILAFDVNQGAFLKSGSFDVAASSPPSVPAFPVDPLRPDPIIEPPPIYYE
jgi:hypothetical protein